MSLGQPDWWEFLTKLMDDPEFHRKIVRPRNLFIGLGFLAISAVGHAAQPVTRHCGGKRDTLTKILKSNKLPPVGGEAIVINALYSQDKRVLPEHRDVEIADVRDPELRAIYNFIWIEKTADVKACSRGLLTAYMDRTPGFLRNYLYPTEVDGKINDIVRRVNYIEMREEEDWGFRAESQRGRADELIRERQNKLK